MANIFTRMFSGKQKEIKKNIFISNTDATTSWTPHDYENFAKETYMKNVISFRCMDLIGKSAASVSWAHYRKVEDGREIIKDSDIMKLLKEPNPKESGAYLTIKAIVYLLISGNTFYQKVGPKTGINANKIKELYVLRPDKMEIVTNKKTNDILAYVYDKQLKFPVDQKTYDSDIIHLKNFWDKWNKK